MALDIGRLVEFVDGKLGFVPVPTKLHQAIALFLDVRLREVIVPKDLGVAFVAPLCVRVAENRFREPDVSFMRKEHADRRGNRFWEGADFVIEVVSEDDPDRDLVTKRAEYAETGIREYWIVDPRDRSILLLDLDKSSRAYREVAPLRDGETACSQSLEGFEVAVSEVFNRPEVSE